MNNNDIYNEINNSNSEELRALLKGGSKELGVELDQIQIDKFFSYMELIKIWNEKFNLTSIQDEHDVVIKHFLDSLSIVPLIAKEKEKHSLNQVDIIDVGTGAGFPSIPLKIALKGLNITMLDSVDKKIKFLNQCIISLGLSSIKAYHGRAEDFAQIKEHRESYNIVVARAVANLPVLLEYCLPFVKKGGIFIAMKGRNTEEIKSSKRALEILGAEIEEIKEIVLPHSDNKRNIIIIKKFRQTSIIYPRKAGKPSKNPLK